jgi:hypothetical protein
MRNAHCGEKRCNGLLTRIRDKESGDSKNSVMVELMLSDALMQISFPDLRQDLDPLLQKEKHY